VDYWFSCFVVFYGLYFWFLTTLKASQERVRASRAFMLDVVIMKKHEYLIKLFFKLSHFGCGTDFLRGLSPKARHPIPGFPLNAFKPCVWLSLAPC
jgi:hypothetical protein